MYRSVESIQMKDIFVRILGLTMGGTGIYLYKGIQSEKPNSLLGADLVSSSKNWLQALGCCSNQRHEIGDIHFTNCD